MYISEKGKRAKAHIQMIQTRIRTLRHVIIIGYFNGHVINRYLSKLIAKSVRIERTMDTPPLE
jgi:hypothetical protein